MIIESNIGRIISMCICFVLTYQSIGFTQSKTDVMHVYTKETIERDGIRLKWFSRNLINDAGWNVYRKSTSPGSDWIKLNKNVILPGNEFYKNKLIQDTLLHNLSTIAEKKWESVEGLHLLLYLKNAVINDNFAHVLGIRFDDNDINANNSYTYKIQAADDPNLFGISEEISIGTHTTIADIDDAKIVYHNDDEVTFAWAPEATEYFGVDIFRKSIHNNKFAKLNDVPVVVTKHKDENGILRYSDVFYRDTSIVDHHTYTYQLRPLDVFGEYGQASQNLEVVVGSKTPPPPPMDVDYEIDEGQPRIRWRAPDADDIVEYIIERSEKPKKHYKEIGRVNASQLYFSDNFHGHGLYYYRVKSVDRYGNVSHHDQKAVELKDSTPPPAPKNFQAVRDNENFTLSWDPVSDEELWGYRVFISHLDNPTDHQFAPIDDSLLLHTSYSFSLNDSIEASYIFAVGAYDIAHNRSALSRSEPIVFEDVIRPTPARLIDIDQQEGIITIDWLPSHHDDVTHYHLLRQISTKSWSYVKEIPHTDERLLFSEAVPDWHVDINYAIVATDDAGWHSDTSNIITINAQREDATDIDIPKKDAIKLIYIPDKKAVRIKWNDNGLDDLKGYVIFRKSDNGNFLPITSLLQETQYVDTDIEPKNEYEYEVRYYHTNHDAGAFQSNKIIIPNNL